MAAQVALNAAFVRLGFGADATAILVNPAKENLTVEALQLVDDKGMRMFGETLSKPGGTIAGLAPARDSAVVHVQNPGVYISTRAEPFCCLLNALALSVHQIDTNCG
jgi:hypothetical protein